MWNLCLTSWTWLSRWCVRSSYEPYSKLRDLLPIVWLWHRYEVEVASKTLGVRSQQTSGFDTETMRRTISLACLEQGVQYQHVVKGGANAAAGRSTPTEARVQWASLRALLRSVDPSSLTMSQRLVDSVRRASICQCSVHVNSRLRSTVVKITTTHSYTREMTMPLHFRYCHQHLDIRRQAPPTQIWIGLAHGWEICSIH